MGVPLLYFWLLWKKYMYAKKKVLEQLHRESSLTTNTETPTVESSNKIDLGLASLPNPNGEFDNLYLDMNGILHHITHGDDDYTMREWSSIKENLYYEMDRIFNLIRPRKLIFIAFDGVAPRAKMNQQRVRRFISARERTEFISKQKKQGKNVETFDSNSITPGTEFMFKASELVKEYIEERVSGCEAWRDLKVIFSDSSVPGEGEHKLIEFIRIQKSQSQGKFDPNTKHVIYGMDADLIFLSLVTHEMNVWILREEIQYNWLSKKPKKFEREEKSDDTLWVGNLPKNVTDEEIFNFFQQIGQVEEVRLIKDNMSKEVYGFCYVRFKDYESFKKGAELRNPVLKGVKLRIDIATKRKKSPVLRKKQREEEEEILISQFISLASVPEDVATYFLSSAAWNLDLALSLFWDDPNNSSFSSNNNNNNNVNANDNNNNDNVNKNDSSNNENVEKNQKSSSKNKKKILGDKEDVEEGRLKKPIQIKLDDDEDQVLLTSIENFLFMPAKKPSDIQKEKEEEISNNNNKKKFSANKNKNEKNNNEINNNNDKNKKDDQPTFELIDVSVLRDYINFEFIHYVSQKLEKLGRKHVKRGEFKIEEKDQVKVEKKPMENIRLSDLKTIETGLELERIVKDLIFISMFVGNDFLPKQTYITIKNDGLYFVFQIYRDFLFHWKSLEYKQKNEEKKEGEGETEKEKAEELLHEKEPYLISFDGEIHCKNFLFFLHKLSYVEKLKMKKKILKNKKSDFRNDQKKNNENLINNNININNNNNIINNNDQNSPLTKNDDLENSKEPFNMFSEQRGGVDDRDMPFFKLGEEDYEEYRNSFYVSKMKFDEDPNKRSLQKENVIFHYLKMMEWVWIYYNKGVSDWRYYYNQYYSPFITDIAAQLEKWVKEKEKGNKEEDNKQEEKISDTIKISENISDNKILLADNYNPVKKDLLKFDFDFNEPYLPFEQLLSVLPSSSHLLVPSSYQPLMTLSPLSLSPYYVKSFTLDLEFSEFVWEAITDIPFMNIEVLKKEMEPLNGGLKEEEKKRNGKNLNKIFFHRNFPLCEYIDTLSHSLSFSKLNTRMCGEVLHITPSNNKSVLFGDYEYPKLEFPLYFFPMVDEMVVPKNTDLPMRTLLKGTNPPRRILHFVNQLFQEPRNNNNTNNFESGENSDENSFTDKKNNNEFKSFSPNKKSFNNHPNQNNQNNPSIPDNQSLILKYIDDDNVFCLNESLENNCKNIFAGNDKFLLSDSDSQLLLNIPFKQPVKIHSLIIECSVLESAPKNISLFINKGCLLFEDCLDLKPTHTLLLDNSSFAENHFILLPTLPFSNVNSLSLFVVDNLGELDSSTRIDRIKIFGTSLSGPKNVDCLQKKNYNRKKNFKK